MDDAVAGVALGPDQQQDVLAVRVAVDHADELLGRGDRLAVDLEDHVAGDDAGVIRRAAGTHTADRRAVHLRRNAELLAHARA